jgi:hypothetical protein
MSKTVAPNIKKVASTGLFEVGVMISGRRIYLPTVHDLEEAKRLESELKGKRKNEDAARVFEEGLKRHRLDAEDAAERAGYPLVQRDDGFPRACVEAGGQVFLGPKRRDVKVAALDGIFLQDKVAAGQGVEAVALLQRNAPTAREKPQSVAVNKQGKYFAFVAVANKSGSGGKQTSFNGPAVDSQALAVMHAALLLKCREDGGDLAALKARLQHEAKSARGSFTEAKGGGWQPKGFPGIPYYRDREEAFEMACRLRGSDAETAAAIVEEERAKVRAQNLEDADACDISEPVGRLPDASETKPGLVFFNVCVGSPEEEANKATGRLWKALNEYLAPGFDVTHVTLRDCRCPRLDGRCDPYSSKDKEEACRRISAYLSADSFAFAVGKAFAATAYELVHSKLKYVQLCHPSMWVAKLYAGRAARSFCDLLGSDVVTAMQLHRLALANRSDLQMENCRKGHMGHVDEEGVETDSD